MAPQDRPALRPRLVILDEPTLGQDWANLRRLMSLLETLNRQGTAVLLISHDWRLVRRYARRVIELRDGRIAYDGDASTFPGGVERRQTHEHEYAFIQHEVIA